MTRQLVLSAPYVVGRVEPGGEFDLRVTVTNPGPLDHYWYPGIQVSSDHPDVTSSVVDWRYGLFAGTSEVIGAHFRVGTNVASGTLLRFTLSAAALHVRCRNLVTLDYSVLVQ